MAQPQENSRLINILEKLAVGALFLIVTWQWAAIGKIEERVYHLQSSGFTVENARILEDRLTKQIDAIRLDVKNETNALRNEMNSKLDLIIKMQTETMPRH
jgi:hypothetical protein